MANESTIADMNEAIALFDGGSSIKDHGGTRYVYYPNSCAKDVLDLKYHTSWDWLMPVWKKAAAIIYGIRGELTKIDYLAAHRVTKEFIDACQNCWNHMAKPTKARQCLKKRNTP